MEILVAISIMVTLASVTFLGNKTLGYNRKVRMTAQKMSSDIRKMQSFVLNLQKHDSSFPEGGWGINIDKSTSDVKYNLFADVDVSSAVNEHNLNDNTSELERTIEIPRGLKIGQIDLDADGADPYSSQNESEINISFSPPDPETWLCTTDGNNCNFQRAKIEITNFDNTVSKYIYINQFGLIDVQDN